MGTNFPMFEIELLNQVEQTESEKLADHDYDLARQAWSRSYAGTDPTHLS